MAIDFDTLFAQIGRVGRLAYVLAGGQAGLPAAFTSLFAQFAGHHNIIGTIETQEDSLVRQNTAGNLMATMTPIAAQSLLTEVGADQPSQANTTQQALVELIRQMNAAGKSVQVCSIGLTPTALSGNIGTGVLVTSTKRGDGLIQQNTIAESARLQCTADSYRLQATAGQEPFQFLGQPIGTSRLWDYDWPLGSGAAIGFNVANPSVDANSSVNLLKNSDFENWSTDPAPVLQNWITSATWGTQLQQSSTPYTQSFSLQWNAATGTTIYQQFNSQSGTPTNPAALNSIAVNLWIRKNTGTITTGIMTVALVDGSGTVVNDAQGNANSFTIDLTTLTTTYVAKNGVFRLPAQPPSVLRLQMSLTTALAGGSVLVDDVCAAPLVAAYAGGPGLRVFAGSVPFAAGDGWSLVTTNDRGSELYGATMQTLFNRLFGTVQSNLLLPYSGSPTHADTLITSP